ncbi:uncharacterized protein EAF01_010459 [Botrytis porri]|uniref:uncharacterized protein n=1 Tax=Botrytis porri TaxID=87229 RepID=UPI0018FF2A98|nr:uncharacterized protein EAF01_010459 [Botrytis porri]KAF7892379.1 hypothetical protein EAF01_010459 [Botrytis porri]
MLLPWSSLMTAKNVPTGVTQPSAYAGNAFRITQVKRGLDLLGVDISSSIYSGWEEEVGLNIRTEW